MGPPRLPLGPAGAQLPRRGQDSEARVDRRPGGDGDGAVLPLHGRGEALAQEPAGVAALAAGDAVGHEVGHLVDDGGAPGEVEGAGARGEGPPRRGGPGGGAEGLLVAVEEDVGPPLPRDVEAGLEEAERVEGPPPLLRRPSLRERRGVVVHDHGPLLVDRGEGGLHPPVEIREPRIPGDGQHQEQRRGAHGGGE